MKFYKFTVLFEKEPGTKETYNVSVPALPGCLTFGESLTHAEYMIQEAMELYLSTLLDEGELIPADKKVRIKKGVIVKQMVVAVKQELSAGVVDYGRETAYPAVA